jgi:two-component system cell cycle sensor histidine kinase/response regulator CckA
MGQIRDQQGASIRTATGLPETATLSILILGGGQPDPASSSWPSAAAGVPLELVHVAEPGAVARRLLELARSGRPPQLVLAGPTLPLSHVRKLLWEWRSVIGDLEVLLVGAPGFAARREEPCIQVVPSGLQPDLVALVAGGIAQRVAQGRSLRLELERERCEREVRSAEIRETESRFAAAFRCLPVPLALLTPDRGRVHEANDRLLQLLGRDVLGLVGYTFEESGCLLDPYAWRGLLERFALEERVRDQPLPLRCGSRILDTRVSMEPLGLPDSRLLLLIIDDQTERLALERQLRHSQKLEAVGQLAAGVAHDFNNLLTVIDGYTGLLLAREDLDGEVVDDVKKIGQASESASALTRKLLAFSRKQVLQPRPVQLNEHVLSLQDMLTRLIGEQVELRFELGPGAPTVLGDPSGIEQVILNLALNARDAMPAGGVVTIGTLVRELAAPMPRNADPAPPGRYLELSVSDTGTGMTEEVRARIFEPFFTTKEPGKGTGLGLSTVLAILRQHGGWIDVRSRLGEGTVVTAYFPVIETVAPSVQRVPVPSLPAVSGRKVLLVEDEESVRSYARIVLTRAGFQVTEAENGDTALELWKGTDGGFGLVVTDMIMPGSLSGGALALELRRGNPKVPILFISGYSAELSDHELVHESVFLAKPFSPGALLAKVQSCLQDPGGTGG